MYRELSSDIFSPSIVVSDRTRSLPKLSVRLTGAMRAGPVYLDRFAAELSYRRDHFMPHFG